MSPGSELNKSTPSLLLTKPLLSDGLMEGFLLPKAPTTVGLDTIKPSDAALWRHTTGKEKKREEKDKSKEVNLFVGRACMLECISQESTLR